MLSAVYRLMSSCSWTTKLSPYAADRVMIRCNAVQEDDQLMDIQGNHKFAAAPQQVWNALMDPAVLKDSIPGAENVTITGNQVDISIRVNIAVINELFILGVQIDQQTPPSHAVLTIDRSGSYGSLKGNVTLDLAADGAGTNLSYTSHIERGGKIGMVPDLVAKPAVEQGLSSFFRKLESNIK
jgi:uncharacterized protein